MVWLGWRLRRRGVRVTGVLTGKQVNRAVTYWVRFHTLGGQLLEGKSQGQAWRDFGHFITGEVSVYYDWEKPTRLMLETELGKRSLLLLFLMGLVMVAAAGLGVWQELRFTGHG